MTDMTRPRITQHGKGFVASLLTTLLAYVLICLGIVLLAQRLDRSESPSMGAAEQRDAALHDALAEIEAAETALHVADYGHAQTRISRAHAQLSLLIAQERDPTDNP